jgi:hypothetical protein
MDDSDTYATAPKSNTAEEAVENLTHHSQIMCILVYIAGQFLAFLQMHVADHIFDRSCRRVPYG